MFLTASRSPAAETSIKDIAGGFGRTSIFSSLFEDTGFEPPHPAERTIAANAIDLIKLNFLVIKYAVESTRMRTVSYTYSDCKPFPSLYRFESILITSGCSAKSSLL